MNTITASEAARRLYVEPQEVAGYAYLVTYGTACTPQRMWSYDALFAVATERGLDKYDYVRLIVPDPPAAKYNEWDDLDSYGPSA